MGDVRKDLIVGMEREEHGPQELDPEQRMEDRHSTKDQKEEECGEIL